VLNIVPRLPLILSEAKCLVIYGASLCTTMVHYPIRLKAHHFVEIVSKQTKKCISPFDITMHCH
ncbi:hypothetical protein, partial [Escherichia coli]